MTGSEWIAIAGILITVMVGTFWRMWGMIKDAADEGEKAQAEVAAHRLHVAEHYATKAGISEQTNLIMKTLENLGGRIDGIHARLDSWSRPPS